MNRFVRFAWWLSIACVGACSSTGNNGGSGGSGGGSGGSGASAGAGGATGGAGGATGGAGGATGGAGGNAGAGPLCMRPATLYGNVIGQTAIQAQAIAEPNGCVLQAGDALTAPGSSEAVMDMGRIAVGKSLQQSFFISNAGLFDCQVSGISQSAPAGPFSLPYPSQTSTPLVLKRTQSKQIDVVFSPTTTGKFELTFTVTSDDAANATRTVHVRGESY